MPEQTNLYFGFTWHDLAKIDASLGANLPTVLGNLLKDNATSDANGDSYEELVMEVIDPSVQQHIKDTVDKIMHKYNVRFARKPSYPTLALCLPDGEVTEDMDESIFAIDLTGRYSSRFLDYYTTNGDSYGRAKRKNPHMKNMLADFIDDMRLKYPIFDIADEIVFEVWY